MITPNRAEATMIWLDQVREDTERRRGGVAWDLSEDGCEATFTTWSGGQRRTLTRCLPKPWTNQLIDQVTDRLAEAADRP